MTLQQIVLIIHDLIPLGVIGVIRHSAWAIKIILGLFWRDIRATGPLPYNTVAAAMTVKGEPPATFALVLAALLREKVDQVCITFDKGETELMALTEQFRLAHADEIDIRWQIVYEKGKRKGLKAAIEMVEGMEIIIAMDSDTIFGDGVVEGIKHAFSRPGIGGVTVAQRAYNPHHLVHYLFDIRLKLRYIVDIPGQALGGHVSCLSGRCSAYLAEPLKRIVGNLVEERWLGIKKTGGGEDKCLTTFLMDEGYHCAVVVNHTVYTRPEASLQVYFSQSLRWARNSWFSDLRALVTRRPWMVRDPIMLFYTLDRMMSTFTLILAVWFMILLLMTQRYEAAALLFGWWLFSRGLKLIPWLLETRKFWMVIPYALSTFWLSFLKVHALVTLWETGWLTRGSSQAAAFSKRLLTNTYRLITATIIVGLGVFFAHNNNIWLADMPVIAEAGRFYRPGEDGLGVVQDVFVSEVPQRTLLVLNDPDNFASLQAALPVLARLGDELAGAAGPLELIRAADLTEESARRAHVVFLERPQPATPLLAQVATLYDRPPRGDRLLNSDPLTAAALPPVRVVPAPWRETARLLLADPAGSISYRIAGERVDSTRAQALFASLPAAAPLFAAPALPPQAQSLAALEAFQPEFVPENDLTRAYRFILTPDIDPAGLSLTLEAAATATLRPGATLRTALNLRDTGPLTVAEGAALRLPLQDLLPAGVERNRHPRELILTLTVDQSDLRDPALPAGSFWRQLEASSHIAWQRTFRWAQTGLDQFPYPFISLTGTDPIVLLLSDAPTPLERNLAVQLVLQLAANGVSAERLHLMRPAALDEALLAQAHIIVPAGDRRSGFTAFIEARARQNRDSGVLDILPDDEAGFVWMSASPWNPQRSIIMAGGLTTAGQALAGRQLLALRPMADIYTDVVIIQPDDDRVPYDGFARDALEAGRIAFGGTPTPP
ncbi:MAG: glycosyltransferase [Anaerolineae bacterium]|nr:glycosyltransferase [Anaerolineae bacterium]